MAFFKIIIYYLSVWQSRGSLEKIAVTRSRILEKGGRGVWVITGSALIAGVCPWGV